MTISVKEHNIFFEVDFVVNRTIGKHVEAGVQVDIQNLSQSSMALGEDSLRSTDVAEEADCMASVDTGTTYFKDRPLGTTTPTKSSAKLKNTPESTDVVEKVFHPASPALRGGKAAEVAPRDQEDLAEDNSIDVGEPPESTTSSVNDKETGQFSHSIRRSKIGKSIAQRNEGVHVKDAHAQDEEEDMDLPDIDGLPEDIPSYEEWRKGNCLFMCTRARCGNFRSTSSTSFWSHVEKMHRLTMKEYQSKYKDPCIRSNKIQCPMCRKSVRHEVGTLKEHAKTAHSVKLRKLYDIYVAKSNGKSVSKHGDNELSESRETISGKDSKKDQLSKCAMREQNQDLDSNFGKKLSTFFGKKGRVTKEEDKKLKEVISGGRNTRKREPIPSSSSHAAESGLKDENHRCDKCGKMFVKLQKLELHKRVHTEGQTENAPDEEVSESNPPQQLEFVKDLTQFDIDEEPTTSSIGGPSETEFNTMDCSNGITAEIPTIKSVETLKSWEDSSFNKAPEDNTELVLGSENLINGDEQEVKSEDGDLDQLGPMDCVDDSASDVDVQDTVKIEVNAEEKDSQVSIPRTTCLVCYKNLSKNLFEDHLATAHNTSLEMYTEVLGESTSDNYGA